MSGYGINQSILIISSLDRDFFEYVVNDYGGNRSINFLRLALIFRKCRRSGLDQLFFLISCVLMIVFRPKLE